MADGGDELTRAGLAGLLWAWWRQDRLPAMAQANPLSISTTSNYEQLAALSGTELVAVVERVATQHRPYVARVGERPVAYGWSAAGRTSFGSPAVRITVPAANRYLLDFATLPAWRGQGIYPALLQAILLQEGGQAERFWILHEASNQASARGIAKAGFQPVGEIHFLRRGGLGLTPMNASERAQAGADLLGLPLID